MKYALLAGLATVALLAATPAHAKKYVCQMQDDPWIPEVVVIDYNESTGGVVVFDGIIKHYMGAPIAGELDLTNSKRITFTWKLANITNKAPGRSQFTSGMLYRMTIQHGSLSARMTARPNGYIDNFRGKGQCKIE